MLNPDRTQAGGWAAMRTALKFPEQLVIFWRVVDLASQGGTILFIDNLDFFNKESRTLVRDLLLAAADVPGIFVLTTARSNFGNDEQNWLPEHALKTLGITTPIWLDELSNTEVDEIQSAVPSLFPLLRILTLPKKVIRNLFRLTYFAKQPTE